MEEGRKKVGYFCMEYGLNPELHTYAGGLGILAGDIIKSAKDLDEDLVGVGILWSNGYVEQFNHDEHVLNKYYSHNYHFIKEKETELEVEIGNKNYLIDVYRTEEFGNNPLYLLDTNRPGNSHEKQMLTSKLYTGSQEQYLLQQALLGEAGLRALEKVGETPDIVHMNESNSMFAGLEVLREEVMEKGSFEKGLETARKKLRFTTHTPVDAGNPKYSFDTIRQSGLEKDYSELPLRELGEDPFNSTLACLRMSGKSNSVSEKHNQTASKMWESFENTSEIVNVTNGVHLPSWQSLKVRKAGNSQELWEAHMYEKELLRKTFEADIDLEKPLIGFARRFTDYKRPELFFKDEEKARELLKHFNIVFAGKAHVNDSRGRELVKKVYRKSKDYDSVIWVENYDMNDASRMVKGCDIWLSCPIPPREACSTSTIKAASSGNLNLSTPDGWWWEAGRNGENGWTYGKEEFHGSREERDRKDAEELYQTLEKKVLPAYQDRDKWLEMMRKSIETVRKGYTGKKMVEKYRENVW